MSTFDPPEPGASVPSPPPGAVARPVEKVPPPPPPQQQRLPSKGGGGPLAVEGPASSGVAPASLPHASTDLQSQWKPFSSTAEPGTQSAVAASEPGVLRTSNAAPTTSDEHGRWPTASDRPADTAVGDRPSPTESDPPANTAFGDNEQVAADFFAPHDRSFDGPRQSWDSWDDESSDDGDFYNDLDGDADADGRLGRRFRRIAVGALVVAAVVGLGIVLLLSRDRAESSSSIATTATTATGGSGVLVPAIAIVGSTTAVTSTGAPTETTVVASTTAAASGPPTATVGTSSATTLPAGPNVFGLENGTAANPLSPLSQERFAAQIGRQSTEVSAGSPASVYAEWWVLFLVRTTDVVASPNGFSFTDASGQRIELSQMVLGPDGKVADLTECVSTSSSAPACIVISNAITVDPTATVVGRTPQVTFTRLAELRLLKRFVVRFVEHAATQPITAATSTVGEVRFDSKVLAFEAPAGNVPATVDVALTYADGTSETVTITV